jgi:D-tyrosyl-tRNA(Tyr) deacylase
MRAVIQRVSEAKVVIAGNTKGSIGRGMLVLLGIEESDTDEDIEWLSGKLVRLRIFDDAEGVMNLGLQESGGEILLISQFTLFASTKKGNRPSYIRAARPELAVPLYEKVIARLTQDFGKAIQTGEFGADMKVSLTNDGPVTILIDTKVKE